MGNFGDKFRNERERREFSLDDVSNVTKISPRMLQAIEEENFNQLPGGVFNKGFVRAYARHLGFNDSEAVTEYLAALREAQIAAQAMWDPGHGTGTRTTRETPEPVLPPLPTARALDRPVFEPELQSPVAASTTSVTPVASESRGVANIEPHNFPNIVHSDIHQDFQSDVPDDAQNDAVQDSDPPIEQTIEPRSVFHLPVAEHLASQEGEPVAEPVPGSAAAKIYGPKTSRSKTSASGLLSSKVSAAALTGWKTPVMFFILLVAVIALWSRHSHSAQGASAASTPATASLPTNAPVAASTPNSTSAAEALAESLKKSNNAPEENSVPASPKPAASQESKNNQNEINNDVVKRELGRKEINNNVQAKNEAPGKEVTRSEIKINKTGNTAIEEKHYGSDVTVRHFRTLAPPPTSQPGPFTLVIRATQNCRISVTADGEVTTHETLIAPAETTLHATRELVVNVGNAAGVTFLLNGTQIPAQSKKPEPKTFTFNSNGIQPSSSE